MDWLYKKLYKCRLCKSTDVQNLLDFGEVNICTANTGTNPKKGDPDLHSLAPLTLNLCKNCLNIQLGEVVNPDILYKNFQYESNVTLGLKEHFKQLATEINDYMNLKKHDWVLDVGSNDGSFLKNFKNLTNILGVEPGNKISDKANKNGIKTLNTFFSNSLADTFLKDNKSFKVIFCANTIANIHDLDDIFNGFKKVLSPNGYLILETQNGIDVVDKFLIDTVYHEHLNYFTINSINSFLKNKSFKIDYVKKHEQKGGSIQLWITHTSNKNKINFIDNQFEKIKSNEIKLLRNENINKIFQSKIKKIKSKINKIKSPIICYGASVGSNTLLNLFFKSVKILSIVDDNPTVSSLPLNGSLIQVNKLRNITINKEVKIIVLAYRYFDKILERNHLIKKDKFIKLIDN
jgi:ubiquinone/menaquinone biosynthesis C-methylase UbiE